MKKALISASILLSLAMVVPAFAISVGGYSDDSAGMEDGQTNVSANVNANVSASSTKRDDEGKIEDVSETEESNSSVGNGSTSKGNEVSEAAEAKFDDSDIKGMTDQEKIQFLQTVKTHAQLQSDKDLENFAKGVLLKDQNVDSVAVNNEDVHVGYRVPAKFLGIFKTHLRAEGDVAFSATSTDRVKVKYPWYSFLFGLNSTSTPDQIKAAIEAELKASSSSEVWMNKNAKGGLYIDVMVKIFSKWLAKE